MLDEHDDDEDEEHLAVDWREVSLVSDGGELQQQRGSCDPWKFRLA
jgi:hypothetical protein